MTSSREAVHRLLFGGQHDAIVEWIDRLQAKVERLEAENARLRGAPC